MLIFVWRRREIRQTFADKKVRLHGKKDPGA